jgi:hypothetical protein
MEVLTDLLMFLLSKSGYFMEIIVFILLNQKSQITNKSLKVISDSVIQCLGVEQYEQRKRDDEHDSEEEEVNKSKKPEKGEAEEHSSTTSRW